MGRCGESWPVAVIQSFRHSANFTRLPTAPRKPQLPLLTLRTQLELRQPLPTNLRLLLLPLPKTLRRIDPINPPQPSRRINNIILQLQSSIQRVRPQNPMKRVHHTLRSSLVVRILMACNVDDFDEHFISIAGSGGVEVLHGEFVEGHVDVVVGQLRRVDVPVCDFTGEGGFFGGVGEDGGGVGDFPDGHFEGGYRRVWVSC